MAIGNMKRGEIVTGDHLWHMGQGPEPVGVRGINTIWEAISQKTPNGHGVLHQGLSLKSAHPERALFRGQIGGTTEFSCSSSRETELQWQGLLGPGGQQTLHIATEASGLRPIGEQVEEERQIAHGAKAPCKRWSQTP